MNKRRLHHFWRWFRIIKPRYLLAAALVCGVVCVVSLRNNNQHMAALRENVYTTDKDDGDVQGALNDLQAYVTAHMNTSLSTGNTSVYPPIQLQYTYQRLLQQQGDQLQAANGDLYTRAQTYCQQQDSVDFSGHNRVPCIEQYVEDHGVKVPAIPASLYEFDFIAPRWSPDLAGWSLLAAIVLLVLTVVKFLVDRHFRKLL